MINGSCIEFLTCWRILEKGFLDLFPTYCIMLFELSMLLPSIGCVTHSHFAMGHPWVIVWITESW